MKNLFISRSLKKDSPFYNLKEELGITIIDRSLIDISGLPIRDVPDTDWVFFYSSNGLRYYFNEIDYDENRQYGVMGEGSARLFLNLTGNLPDFTGKGSSDDIADAFLGRMGSASLLIVRAEQSLNFLNEYLEDRDEVFELVAYKNFIKKEFDLPHCEYLVFTSPMNAEAYFSKYPYKDQQIFAIGNSTATKVKELTGIMPPYCDDPGMAGLYRLVEEHIMT